ncbi:UgpB ABC-type sugar transport system, periplasmic component [Rhabdaerophilaceae bacterium]
MLSRRSFVAATLAAPVAAPAIAQSRQTEITIYHYQNDKRGEVFKDIIRRFEAANPDIKVNDIFKTDATITAELQAALAARRPVDLGTVIGIRVQFYRMRAPVFAFDEDPAQAKWLENYLPNFLDVGRHAGKVYAVPYAFGTPMLYHNRDMAKKAGLNVDMPPKTWDEVIEWAKRIQAANDIPGLAHLHASNKVYGTMLMAQNAGGRYIAESGERVALDSAEGIAAMQLWQDLAVTHKVMPIANDSQWTAAFMGQRLGMYITSSALLRQAVETAKGKFELGVGEYPLFPGRTARRLPNSGATFMLFSPPGPRREASLRFMAFLSELSVANEWSRESGYMPLMRDPLRDPAMKAYADSFPYVKPVIAQMKDTVATETWNHSNALAAESIVSTMIDDLWAGKGRAAELVPDAVKRANAALARSN